MKTSELNIKLDQYGNVDADYYIAEAKAQRSEVLAELFSSITRRIKQISFKRQPKSFNSTRSFGTV